MKRCIDKFIGPYYWLSNFEYVQIIMPDRIQYPTVEHAFQAYKTTDLNKRREIANLKWPGQAKRIGRQIKLREDWEAIKFYVMLQAIRIKFTNTYFRDKLLATGDAKLVEGNNWGDRIWGVYKGRGQNHLGCILMQVREEIRNKENNHATIS